MSIKNISITTIDTNMLDLNITFEKQLFVDIGQELYTKYMPQMNIKGFRQGKIPFNVFEKHINQEAYHNTIMQNIMNRFLEEILEKNGIEAVDVSEGKLVNLDSKEEFGMSVKIITKPIATLGEYKGLKINRIPREVTEEDILKELQNIAESNARVFTIDDRPIEKNDTVTINYDITIEETGEVINSEKYYNVLIGKNHFIDELEEGFIGRNIGDKLSFKTFNDKGIFGEKGKDKNLIVNVEILNITCKTIPEIDDELAQDVSEFDTLEELKTSVKNKLLEKAKSEEKEMLAEQIMQLLMRNSSVEIPEILIAKNVEYMSQKLNNSLQSARMSFEQYLNSTGETVSQLEERLKKTAKEEMFKEAIISKVIKLENIDISEEELQEKFKEVAEVRRMTLAELMPRLDKYMIKSIKQSTIRNKALEFLIEQSIIN